MFGILRSFSLVLHSCAKHEGNSMWIFHSILTGDHFCCPLPFLHRNIIMDIFLWSEEHWTIDGNGCCSVSEHYLCRAVMVKQATRMGVKSRLIYSLCSQLEMATVMLNRSVLETNPFQSAGLNSGIELKRNRTGQFNRGSRWNRKTLNNNWKEGFWVAKKPKSCYKRVMKLIQTHFLTRERCEMDGFRAKTILFVHGAKLWNHS